jgi:hypothetical protein
VSLEESKGCGGVFMRDFIIYFISFMVSGVFAGMLGFWLDRRFENERGLVTGVSAFSAALIFALMFYFFEVTPSGNEIISSISNLWV